MRDLVIQSQIGPYTVRFGAPFAGLEAGLDPREHLIIDERVAGLYAQPLARSLAGYSVLRIPATEANKSLEKFPAYIIHLLEHGVRRDHTLVAVGGGILQDIVCFLAATVLRGMPWRFHPTTLLAQADSCIGSKSSVNVGRYKNQLGTFTPPADILVSTGLLDTLAPSDFCSGLGEVIKVHIISGWQDFRALARDYPLLMGDRVLLETYIRRALEIKKLRIEADEFDRHERLVMNYGHTFGHAIESATGYAVPHGIAVTIGLDFANYVSWRLGLIGGDVFDELHAVAAANYAGFTAVPIPEDAFFDALARDKKNLGARQISLVLLRGPGEVFLDRYPNDERFKDVCREFLARLFSSAVRTVAL